MSTSTRLFYLSEVDYWAVAVLGLCSLLSLVF